MKDLPTTGMTLDELGNGVGLSEQVIRSKLQTFNAEEAAPSVNPRTLKNWVRDGIPFREEPSRVWTISFLTWLLDQPDVTINSSAVARLIDHLSAPRASEKASQPKKKRVPMDLAGFSTRLRQAASGNKIIADNRERQSGYYRIVRKTTQDDKQQYYEEPLFVGGANQPTWLVSEQHGLNEGFTFTTMGVTTVVLAHSHDKHAIGLRVIQFDFDDSRGPAFSGVMLRLSDKANRPAASKIIAVRVSDTSEDAISWQAYADAFDSEKDETFSHDLVQEIKEDHARFETYQQLRLDDNLKAELPDQWDALRTLLLNSP